MTVHLLWAENIVALAIGASFLFCRSECHPYSPLWGARWEERRARLTWDCWDWTGSLSRHPEEIVGIHVITVPRDAGGE